MRRFFVIAIAAVGLSLTAGAQDMYYAEMLSRNHYYGTARSMGLGNAMTALGGDLGSVTINPAGSAVSPYSQFTITPGLLFSSTGASYAPDGSENFGSPLKTDHTKFNMPNIGLSFTYFNGPASWVKSVSMGFVANTTNSYLNYTTGQGSNSSTSFLGSLASGARGLDYNSLPRDLHAAYNANQFGEYGPVGSNIYVGSNERLDPSEAYHYVPGALSQRAVYNTFGTKTDMAFNLAFNVQDVFYFGFNIGLPMIKYRRSETFGEAAQQPELFPTTFFVSDTQTETTNYVSSTNTYALNTDANGVYAKFGFIALPTDHLRIGAAIQTPTKFAVSERWAYSASSQYENSKFDGNSTSTVGEANYYLRTPYVVNAGIAYTLPGVGLFSIDYELTDYSVMKYSEAGDSFYDDSWASVNMVNRTFCGSSHSVRMGVEVKPLPFISLRAGYSLTTDPEKYWTDEKGNRVTAETVDFLGNSEAFKQQLISSRHFDNLTHGVSLGAGYSSPGSFFADFAVRMTSYPVSYYAPYYYGAYDAKDKNGVSLNIGAPLERLDKKMFDVLLTLGWRF